MEVRRYGGVTKACSDHSFISEKTLQERLQLHIDASKAVKHAARSLGFQQLPELEEESANGMTAVSHIPFHFMRLLIHLSIHLAILSSRALGGRYTASPRLA